MARIHIELPAHLPFATEITLYLSHMNYGNHLDNALLLTVVSEARVRFLQSLGYTELDIEGVGLVVADAALQYRSEARHGETMRVEMGVAELGKQGGDLLWRMSETVSGREVARGKTGILFFDYGQRQVVPVPAAFRQAIMAQHGAV